MFLPFILTWKKSKSAQTAVALAYSLGPLTGGYLVQSIGFKVICIQQTTNWYLIYILNAQALMRSLGFLNLIFCPVLLFLRRLLELQSPFTNIVPSKMQQIHQEMPFCALQDVWRYRWHSSAFFQISWLVVSWKEGLNPSLLWSFDRCLDMLSVLWRKICLGPKPILPSLSDSRSWSARY